MDVDKLVRKISEKIYRIGDCTSEKVVANLRILNPGKSCKETSRQYYVSKISSCIKLGVGTALLAIIIYICLSAGEEELLLRNTYGEGSKTITMKVDIDGVQKPMKLEISERGYTKEEISVLYEQLTEQLESLILHENREIEAITGNLALLSEYEGYPFSIQWSSSDYDILSSDGTLQKENIAECGNEVVLSAEITYEDFSAVQELTVHTADYDDCISPYEELVLAVQDADLASRTKSKMELPTRLNGKKIKWYTNQKKLGLFLPLIVTAIVIGTFFLQDIELKKKIESRNWQLRTDYPDLVSKLTLLIGAGMTVRAAWYKIAGDYRRRRELGAETRYVYEEMLLTCREMEDGISEYSAYENFGKRCNEILYMKFGSLLCRNLRRGAGGLCDVLRAEASEAFEIRKNMARQMGEKAGTKMLLPNGMLLAVVLIMVMIPAFWSF